MIRRYLKISNYGVIRREKTILPRNDIVMTRLKIKRKNLWFFSLLPRGLRDNIDRSSLELPIFARHCSSPHQPCNIFFIDRAPHCALCCSLSPPLCSQHHYSMQCDCLLHFCGRFFPLTNAFALPLDDVVCVVRSTKLIFFCI